LQTPGAAEASVRNLPPSAIGDPSNLDAMGLLSANKGRPMEGIVEQVRDGSTVRVYLLPEFQFVQVFVAGIQVYMIHDSIRNRLHLYESVVCMYFRYESHFESQFNMMNP
jgi:hypothetical protein